MKFPKSLVIEIVSILLLTVMLMAWAVYHSRNRTVAAVVAATPVPVRTPSAEWVEAHAGPAISEAPDVTQLGTIETSTTRNGVQITLPDPGTPPPNSYPYQIHRMRTTETLTIDGMQLKLAAIELETIDYLSSQTRTVTYSPTMQIVSSTTQTLDNPWFYDCVFPELRFRFEATAASRPEVGVVATKLFDARTKWRVTGNGSGWSSSFHGGKTHVTSHARLAALRQVPIEAMIELSCGPVETYTFPAKAGEGFTSGPLALRLMAYNPAGRLGSTNGNGSIKITAAPSRDQQELAFFTWPGCSVLACECEALDRDGKAVPSWGSSASDNVWQPGFEGKNRIETIRIKRRTRHHRIFIELPPIPAMQRTTDSLEIKAPYASFKSSTDVENFIEAVLQINGITFKGPAPAKQNNLQMTVRNSTVREIITRYAVGAEYRIDPQTNSLVVTYPEPPVPFSQRVMRFLKNMY